MFIVLGPCFPFCSGCFWGPSGRSSKETKKKQHTGYILDHLNSFFTAFWDPPLSPAPMDHFLCCLSLFFVWLVMCCFLFFWCVHVFSMFVSMFFHGFPCFFHVFAWFSMFLQVFTMRFPCFFHVFCCFLLAFCLLFGPFLHICLDHRLSLGPVVLWWGNWASTKWKTWGKPGGVPSTKSKTRVKP